MEWRLSFNGNDLATLISQAEGEDDEAIAILSDGPSIEKASRWYWRCFQDLESDRPPSANGIARIPFTSIRSYADEEGLTGGLRRAFFRVIKTVDERYCVLISKQIHTNRNKKH